jgi:hypothetical protein
MGIEFFYFSIRMHMGEGAEGKKVRNTSNDEGGQSVSEKSKSMGGKCVSENSTGGKSGATRTSNTPIKK